MRFLYVRREIHRVVRQYWLGIRSDANGNIPRLILSSIRIIVARLWYGIGPMYYSLYRLSKVSRKEWRNYITDDPEFKKFLLAKSPEQIKFIVNDKLAFYDHCSKHALPTIPVLCILANATASRTSDVVHVSNIDQWRSVMKTSPNEMFIKPVDGTYGEGAFTVVRSNNTVEFDGRTAAIDDLFDYLMNRLSGKSGWLVQPRMRGHPFLNGIVSPHGLATARVITYMNGNNPELFIADFKITVGDAVTDNFSKGKSGNLLSAVDRDTGALSAAWGSLSTDWPVMSSFSRHPESQHQIEGLVLPFWKDLVALALAGQRSLPQMRTIGWDIAPTTDGLVLVEANSAYDVSILQIAHQRGLKQEITAVLG